MLTEMQLASYREEGYVFLPSFIDQSLLGRVRAQLPHVLAQDSEGKVFESNSQYVRSVYGAHSSNAVLAELTNDVVLVRAAVQIVGSAVYVYQFKINAKAAFGGDVWPWHQDYIFWREEDGMPSPAVTNAAVLLDEVNEFNGPMLFIPKSHHHGVLAHTQSKAQNSQRRGLPSWSAHVGADLDYPIDHAIVRELARQYGITAPKGPAGSVIFFDANVVHASSANIAPFDRAMAIVTYNSIDNLPAGGKSLRPEFLVNHSPRPIH